MLQSLSKHRICWTCTLCFRWCLSIWLRTIGRIARTTSGRTNSSISDSLVCKNVKKIQDKKWLIFIFAKSLLTKNMFLYTNKNVQKKRNFFCSNMFHIFDIFLIPLVKECTEHSMSSSRRYSINKILPTKNKDRMKISERLELSFDLYPV